MSPQQRVPCSHAGDLQWCLCCITCSADHSCLAWSGCGWLVRALTDGTVIRLELHSQGASQRCYTSKNAFYTLHCARGAVSCPQRRVITHLRHAAEGICGCQRSACMAMVPSGWRSSSSTASHECCVVWRCTCAAIDLPSLFHAADLSPVALCLQLSCQARCRTDTF